MVDIILRGYQPIISSSQNENHGAQPVARDKIHACHAGCFAPIAPSTYLSHLKRWAKMKIFVSQIYIQVGINFPFSHVFQKYIHEMLSACTHPSETFIRRYGADFTLMFRMSAKEKITETEIAGPTVYKKDKDVEYSLFLPFDRISSSKDKHEAALQHLFAGIVKVLESLQVNTDRITENSEFWIHQICSNPSMFKVDQK